VNNNYTRADITRVHTTRTRTARQKSELDDHLNALETQLGLSARWDSNHSRRVTLKHLITNRKLLKAIDHLERVVVERLFELTKLNLSGTGEHIY
jgi:hypothetical protein